MRSDDVSSRGHTPFEEFDDELNGFEVGESLPCGLYRCGGGVDGVTGNFGCFYSRVPCGGKRFCRGMCGSFANRDDLIQRLLSGLMGLELRRSDLFVIVYFGFTDGSTGSHLR